MKRLENKWAFVTGSSRGIGQQIVWGLAERGCNIIVHGRKPNNLEANRWVLHGRTIIPYQ